jgi:hypothetical protein
MWSPVSCNVKLIFGVLDIEYGFAYGEDTIDPNITTGQVATELEFRYEVLKTFYELHEKEIREIIEETIQGFIVFVGQTGLKKDKRIYLDRITPLFHSFLDNQEMDGIVDGVPTKRSLDGITHRRKKRVIKTKKGKVIPRPSFEDSLLYRNSFKCWLEIKI